MSQRPDSAAGPILYILGGLPGTGKTTLAQLLAARVHAVHLRVDTIEHALRQAGSPVTGPEGYMVAYGVAADALRIGLSVVADTVNPWPQTRAAWREVATAAGAPFVEIEVICSDPSEHRARVEGRQPDIEGFRLPSWDDVVSRDYRPWDREHVAVDTVGQSVEQSFAALLQSLYLD